MYTQSKYKSKNNKRCWHYRAFKAWTPLTQNKWNGFDLSDFHSDISQTKLEELYIWLFFQVIEYVPLLF